MSLVCETLLPIMSFKAILISFTRLWIFLRILSLSLVFKMLLFLVIQMFQSMTTSNTFQQHHKQVLLQFSRLRGQPLHLVIDSSCLYHQNRKVGPNFLTKLTVEQYHPHIQRILRPVIEIMGAQVFLRIKLKSNKLLLII